MPLEAPVIAIGLPLRSIDGIGKGELLARR
jgi:hypothetical protein